MDAFGYLSVLLSIIVGLGLAQVLTAMGRLIRHRENVVFDWLPLLWAGVMLIVFVQVWWSMFGMRTRTDWSFVSFLLVLAQCCTLYMMAAVVLPEQVEERAVDLAAHYQRQHRWFFGFFLATLVISVIKDLVINGHWPTPLNLGFHFLLAATCVSAIIVDNRRYHEVVGLTTPAALGLYIGLLFMRLS